MGSLCVTDARGSGLTSEEVIKLLGDTRKDLTPGYIAAVLWPKLWRSLQGIVHGPEMVAEEGTVSFLHMQARMASERRFVGTPETRKVRHVSLAKLFTALSEEAAFKAGADQRAEIRSGQDEQRYSRLLRKKTFHQRHADQHLDVLVAARVRPPTENANQQGPSSRACQKSVR